MLYALIAAGLPVGFAAPALAEPTRTDQVRPGVISGRWAPALSLDHLEGDGHFDLADYATDTKDTCPRAVLVALSGVIGFVGLMVPHIARALVGVRHGPLVLTSALFGAMLLVASDLLSRVILAPQELPVGIIASAAGALFVLAIVLRR